MKHFLRKILIVSIFAVILPIFASGIGGFDIYESQATYINYLENKYNTDVALVVNSEEKTYNSYAYAAVGYELSREYSADKKNRTFFFAPNGTDKSNEFVVSNGNETFSIDTSTLAIQDYGERHIDYIGLKLEYGKLPSSSPNDDECYLTYNVALQIMEYYKLNSFEDLIYKSEKQDNFTFTYNGFKLKVHGIISKSSSSPFEKIFGSFIVIDRYCMRDKNSGNLYLVCLFGRGQLSVYSYLGEMNRLHPKSKGYKYSFSYAANETIISKEESAFFYNTIAHYPISAAIIYILDLILLVYFFLLLKYGYLNKMLNDKINKLIFILPIVSLLIYIINKFIKTISLFGQCINLIPIIGITLSIVVLFIELIAIFIFSVKVIKVTESA